MDIGSFLLLLALIIAIGTFVASPLRVRRGAYGLRPEDHEISELLAERERVLESLDELDLDYAMGKVPEDLYPQQRDILMKRGADVLRVLDAFTAKDSGKTPAVDAAGDDPLEAMIAARKADFGDGGEDAMEAMIAARRADAQKAFSQEEQEPAAAKKPAGKFCPNCGGKIEAGDRFCASCGKKL